MDVQALLAMLLPQLGQAGIDALKDKLDDLGGDQEGWQKAVLELTANAIDEHGAQGLQIALDVINDLFEDKEVDIDWADLGVSSNILAELQNAEAGRKSAAKDYMAKVSETFGPILSGIIKGIIAA